MKTVKNIIIVLLCIYAIASTIYSVKTTQDRNEWEDTGRATIEACKAVDEYCDSTADSGEMDEFLQSNSGQKFVHYWNEARLFNQ